MAVTKLATFTRNSGGQPIGPGEPGNLLGPVKAAYDFFAVGAGTDNEITMRPDTHPRIVTALKIPANSVLLYTSIFLRKTGATSGGCNATFHFRPLSQINSAAYAAASNYTVDGVSENATGMVGNIAITTSTTVGWRVHWNQSSNRNAVITAPNISNAVDEAPDIDGFASSDFQKNFLDVDTYLTFECTGAGTGNNNGFYISASALYAEQA